MDPKVIELLKQAGGAKDAETKDGFIAAALKLLGKVKDKTKEKSAAAGLKLGGGAFDILEEAATIYTGKKDIIKNSGLLLDALSGPEGLFGKLTQFGEDGVGVFGSIDKGVLASAELGSNMQGLFKVFEESGGTLSRTASVFKELGVDIGTLGDVLDGAILGFGMSGKAADELARSVAGIGEATGVGMQRAMENFSAAQKSMAYDSKTLMENFKGLQLTAGQTGVSFGSLTSAFGETMDEFSGSARKAGSLNAILGRSVFNSIDLLGKTESERVSTIVKGIKESVDVKALGKNKFQLKAVADGLGLTPDETRRLLTGQMSVDEALAGKESKDPAKRAMAKMADLLEKRANPSIEQFEFTIRRTRAAMENVAAGFNEQQRNIINAGLKGAVKATGMDDIFKNLTPAGIKRSLDNIINNLDADAAQRVLKSAGFSLEELQGKGVLDIGKDFFMKGDNKESAFQRMLTTLKEEGATSALEPTEFGTPNEVDRYGRFRLGREFSTTINENTSAESIDGAIEAFKGGLDEVVTYMKKLVNLKK
tara:strand:+ start:3962 stop:5575 length:1614 start_codon:yes stop_codon:yes gene_type:complete